jgi:N-acetylneuraminic acid mutarotase
VGVAEGILLVAGGANFPQAPPWEDGQKVWYDQVWGLERDARAWREVGRLTMPAGYGVSITTDAGLICVGGSQAEGHLADVYRLNLTGEGLSITPLPSLPAPVANACGAMLGRTIYIAGGSRTPASTSALNSFYALDLSAEPLHWQELEPWPGPARMLSVSAVVDDHFYLLSGVDLAADAAGQPVRQYLTDAYRFHPLRGWSRIADLPRAVAAAPSPALSTGRFQFMVVGGDAGSSIGFQPISRHPGFSSHICVYDTASNIWSQVGQTPASRVTTTTVKWGDQWWIPSGEVRPGVRSPEVWHATVGPND